MADIDVENEKAALVEVLLTRGANVNAITAEGDTALHFIAEQVYAK